jgi:CRP/FNR family cyclic AMP-dependent transcriptional regulator
MIEACKRKRTQSILRQSQWFNGLSAKLQAMILDHSIIRKAAKGHVVMHEDSNSKGMCAVLEGQAALTRWVGDDKSFFYYLGGPGFWFGDTAALMHSSTLVTVTARTDLQYLFLPIAQLDSIVAADAVYFREFAGLALERGAVILRGLAQAHLLPPEARLCERLADLGDLFKYDQSGSNPIELAISQFDLAQMIGCSRQTVNVMLRGLEEQRLISVAFRKITIHDTAALRGHVKTRDASSSTVR